ncbi:hypothetical protein CFAM422_000579 [Trichoderma lentiforme]|uniref:Uncharacterized protein n=1 Tax=Trichoderma lentiforme TaxID=1567552 RepID=A0A9P4XRE1_9HYPO|nr:hypothetical protein CFAM422_000579 [Trichoderma lentiforme]
MEVRASTQKDKKADCRNPRDESSTSDGSEPPNLLGADVELATVESRKRSRQPRRSHGRRRVNKQAVTVDDGEELLQKLTLSRKRAASPSPSSSPSLPSSRIRKKVKFALDDSACKQEVGFKSYKNPREEFEELTKVLFPLDGRIYNLPTQHVRAELKKRYFEERHSWSNEMREEFPRLAPSMDFSMNIDALSISDHKISLDAHSSGATWIHFWFLRVIYGPCVCSRQNWFPDLAQNYPWMLETAPEGVMNWEVQLFPDLRESYERLIPMSETPQIPKRETIDTPNRYIDKETGKTASNEAAPDESFHCCSPDPSSPIIGQFDI